MAEKYSAKSIGEIREKFDIVELRKRVRKHGDSLLGDSSIRQREINYKIGEIKNVC